MSKNLGFNYQSHSISKHSDNYFKEEEEVFDYVKNEKRSIKRYSQRTNVQRGSTWSTGLGYFPDPKPALAEGNSCKEIVERGGSYSNAIGLKYGNRDVKPKEGDADSGSDEEIDVCPPDPNRPGLKYKRTRRRKATYKEGDHVKQSSFGIGFNW